MNEQNNEAPQLPKYFNSLEFLWVLLGGSAMLLFALLNLQYPKYQIPTPSVQPSVGSTQVTPQVIVNNSNTSLKFLDNELHNKATVYTYANDFYIEGSIQTDSPTFSISVSLNGSELGHYAIYTNNGSNVVDYFGASFIPQRERDVKKFILPVRNLNTGMNNVTVKVTDLTGSSTVLTQESFSINKLLPTQNADVSVDSYFAVMDPASIFHKLGLDPASDPIWEYDPNYSYPVSSELKDPSQFLLGKGSSWFDYKLVSIGKITVRAKPYPLYKLSYTVNADGMYPFESSLIFYKDDIGVFYFPETLVTQNPVDPYFIHFMKASEYSLPDSVFTLKELPVNDTNTFVPRSGRLGSINCQGEQFQYPILSYKTFTVNGSFAVKDQYNNCLLFTLRPAYIRNEPYGGQDQLNSSTNSDFNKMDITLDDGKQLNDFYNPYSYWCGGSSTYRTLRTVSSENFEKVGKTSTGEDVYIFSENTPYLAPADLPKMKNSDTGDTVKEEDWKNFLSSQKNDYPILIVKDYFGNWVEYISEPYFFAPGC